MTVILGPCPCQGCGVLLWWVRTFRGTLRWAEGRTEVTARVHRCAARVAA